MPAYNAERYIEEAIESILKQTFRDFEFIIIDDCSSDRTWEIIQSFAQKDARIVALRNEKNMRISLTLNKGIEMARGTYIARMDADDWSYPYRLEKQVVFMDAHPEVGVSGGSMEVCDANMRRIGERRYNLTDSDIRRKLFRYSPFSHPLAVFRTSILRENAFVYGPSLAIAEDYDLYFRIGTVSSFGNLPDILIKYRMIGSGISMSKARIQERLTLYIRLKAIVEYGYTARASDVIYGVLQFLSMFIIPPMLKVKIFNYFRNSQ